MYDNIEYIVACAGKSTRNYPHSKGIAHKCLLPFGDIRLIDCVLQDIVRMGARHITLVCSDETTIEAIKTALRTDEKTENKLRNAGRDRIADSLRATFLPDDIDLKFVIQAEPLGTAQVLGLAHRASPDRHGVLIFPDDLVDSSKAGITWIKKLSDSFLKDTKQILMTGVEQEDVSNNAILVNRRLIEKPKNPANHVGIYSPMVFPKQCLDAIEAEATEIEKTGKMPTYMTNAEWIYTDVVNEFLNNGGEAEGFRVAIEKLDPTIYYQLDTGTLPLYEKAMLRELMTRSLFSKENRAYVREILKDFDNE